MTSNNKVEKVGGGVGENVWGNYLYILGDDGEKESAEIFKSSLGGGKLVLDIGALLGMQKELKELQNKFVEMATKFHKQTETETVLFEKNKTLRNEVVKLKGEIEEQKHEISSLTTHNKMLQSTLSQQSSKKKKIILTKKPSSMSSTIRKVRSQSDLPKPTGLSLKMPKKEKDETYSQEDYNLILTKGKAQLLVKIKRELLNPQKKLDPAAQKIVSTTLDKISTKLQGKRIEFKLEKGQGISPTPKAPDESDDEGGGQDSFISVLNTFSIQKN